MTPKAASTEFLIPELMRNKLYRPISQTTERGAEQHHRHRGQYDGDAGGSGGAIGHRTRRQESIVRNVAAAKQRAYDEGMGSLVEAVCTESRPSPHMSVNIDVDVDCEDSTHTTRDSDSDDGDVDQFEFHQSKEVWGGCDLNSLRFGEGYPQELVGCETRVGESARPVVPTSFSLTKTHTVTVDLLQSEIKLQVDIAPPTSILRWKFTFPINALTHVGLEVNTVRLAFAVPMMVSYLDDNKKKIALSTADVRHSAVATVGHATCEFDSQDDAQQFMESLRYSIGSFAMERLATSPLLETISLQFARDGLWEDTKLLNDPVSVFSSRQQDTPAAEKMERALQDNLLVYEKTNPVQVDDPSVSANNCVVCNGAAFYIECRACTILCPVCNDRHHLMCWYDKKGNWVGEDGELHNQCKTTFDDGYIKVDRLPPRPIECMPVEIHLCTSVSII